MWSPFSPVPSILCPEILPFITLSGTTSALNKFHCLYISTSEIWWRKAHNCSDWFQFQFVASTRTGYSHLYGKPSSSLGALSPCLWLAISNGLPVLTPPTPLPDLSLLTQNLSYLQREKERDSLHPPYCWAVPSPLPGCPSCALDPWHLTSSHSGPSIACFCNTPVHFTVSFPPALTLEWLWYESGKK